MRRILILVLLLGGMQLVLPLGARGYGGQWLLSFGFLVVAADTVGRLGASVGLPTIVGYLATGVLFGPSVLGTLSDDAARQLAPVSSLAIALIAFLAGAELRWSELRERGILILKILFTEMSFTLIAITAVMFALRQYVPFLDGLDSATVVALSLMFASLSVVHSPAVTMALLTETKARGPVARTTLGVVLVSDVAVIVLFSGVLALVRAMAPETASSSDQVSVTGLLWEVGGAVIIGSVIGAGVALYLRFVRRELFLFAILVAFFGDEIARLSHVEALLTMLTAGFVAENVSEHTLGEALRTAMERSAAPVFVVFFALAGASLNIASLASLWFLVIPIVLMRFLALWSGSRLGARWGKSSDVEQKYVWLGLVSQAGVAIGLATIVSNVFPGRGGEMSTLFLATLAVNQTLGPIFFRYALSKSGEVVEESQTAEMEVPTPSTA